jgi:hypothetical protein
MEWHFRSAEISARAERLISGGGLCLGFGALEGEAAPSGDIRDFPS